MHLQTMERSQDAVTRDREEEKMSGAPGTILFVEDEAFVRDVTCEVLQSAGYRVLSATNAAEAMRLCDQHCGAVDLLLSDVVLPGESGWTLARKLRRENPFVKSLLVTGYAEQMGLKGGEAPRSFWPSRFLLRRRSRACVSYWARGFQVKQTEHILKRSCDNA